MRARRLTTEDLTWYAIAVEPQREITVDDDLRGRGFESYCPRRVIWVRKARSRNIKDRVRREYPLIGRYVFVGFLADPPWLRVCDLDHVVGPVGFDGEPSRIRPAQIQSLMDRESRGVWREEEWARALRRGEAIQIGTRVRVQSKRDPEQLTEQVFEIEGVSGSQALLRGLGLLGASVVKVPLERLRRAG